MSIPPAGFEPTIFAVERPQTYALDRAATGTGLHMGFLDTGEVSKGCYKTDAIYGKTGICVNKDASRLFRPYSSEALVQESLNSRGHFFSLPRQYRCMELL
jgi:hypothetical protein